MAAGVRIRLGLQYVEAIELQTSGDEASVSIRLQKAKARELRLSGSATSTRIVAVVTAAVGKSLQERCLAFLPDTIAVSCGEKPAKATADPKRPPKKADPAKEQKAQPRAAQKGLTYGFDCLAHPC